MAVPESQAFHQQTRDLLNRIALGGMKIDLQRGHRYTHPSFKGLPFNSTGSMNRMAFESKAENHTPLEAKVMAGGARTQKAQEHYQKKLKGVAEWTRNQQLMKEGLPPNPPNPEEFQLPVEDSLKLELQQQLMALNDAIEVGDLNSVTIKEFGALPRLIIRYLAVTTDKNELADTINYIDGNLFDALTELSNPSVRGNEGADLKQRERAQKVLDSIVEPVVHLVEDYMDYINKKWDGSDKSRLLALRSAIKKNLKYKETFREALEDGWNQWEARRAEEGEAPRENPYERGARPVVLPPPVEPAPAPQTARRIRLRRVDAEGNPIE